MAEITAGMVKELRERSGAGIMDAKGALQETDGDLDVVTAAGNGAPNRVFVNSGGSFSTTALGDAARSTPR